MDETVLGVPTQAAPKRFPLKKEKVNRKMPYVSDAQRRFFNANRAKMEKQGVDVDEYNETSKGKKLPERARRKKGIGHRIAKSFGLGQMGSK